MAEETEPTKKRVRSSNYTLEEKACLINIINKYKNIVESKKTDKLSWKDKSTAWETIASEFNASAPNRTYRSTDSLKKFYENLKKDTRKVAAQEKMELFKTGGGKPAQKVLDPLHESVLNLMNTKTVEGLANKFDCDTNILNSLSTENNNNITDNVTGRVINVNSNRFNEDMEEEYDTYEILDDDLVEGPEAVYDVDNNTYEPLNESTKKTKNLSSWNKYTPNQLKTPKHTSLKISTKTNSLEYKENDALLRTKARQRRPSTMALNSSHISKQYGDLAEIKMELAQLQLTALKAEMVAKEKQNEMEFLLKKKSLELDIQLKQEQFKKIQTSSFNYLFCNAYINYKTDVSRCLGIFNASNILQLIN